MALKNMKEFTIVVHVTTATRQGLLEQDTYNKVLNEYIILNMALPRPQWW